MWYKRKDLWLIISIGIFCLVFLQINSSISEYFNKRIDKLEKRVTTSEEEENIARIKARGEKLRIQRAKIDSFSNIVYLMIIKVALASDSFLSKVPYSKSRSDSATRQILLNGDFTDSYQIPQSEFFKFSRSKYKDYGWFYDTVSAGYFGKDVFKDEAIFKECVFPRDVKFNSTFFHGKVWFRNAVFMKKANFSYAHFSSTVNLSEVRFSGALHLNGLEMGPQASLNFSGSSLPDTISFAYNSILPRVVDFQVADFSKRKIDEESGNLKPIWIYLYKSDISRLRLDYSHFRLLLPDSILMESDYSALEKVDRLLSKNSSWSKKVAVSNDEKAGIYEALLNNFKSNGQTESYKLLDIEYQTFKWRNSWASGLTWLPKYWWNFGYDKEYIFKWTAGFIFFLHLLPTYSFSI